MQECCCFALAIRQKSCQNSISRCIDNVYTNITLGSSIPLEFGYNITVTNITCSKITIKLSNPDFIPDLTFNITNNSFKLFDLPQQACCLQVCIGVKQISCPPTCGCNN